jgi:hypothetical protein
VDRVGALQLIALRNVLKPNEEYNLRYIFRWYSKTFSTPLHMVEDLDLDDILLAFFEERYERMTSDERLEERDNLLEDGDARKARETAEEAEKIAEAELMKMSVEQNVKKVAEKAAMQKAVEPLGLAKLPETEDQRVAPPVPPPDEEIKIEFVDDKDIEALMSGGMANDTKE